MYSAEINRKQPALLMLLVDQSYSMLEPWGQGVGSKSEALAAAVNNAIGNAVLMCNKGGEKVYNYLEIGVFGYGATTGPILHGADPNRPILPIDDVATNPRRVDTVRRRAPDGAGGVIEIEQTAPIWVDPVADGGTPMAAAFTQAEPVIETWCAAHPKSYPPLIINVTDGASTDGDPSPVAARIRELRTDDGQALVFNLHLSAIAALPVIFPTSAAGLTDSYARMLFDMSSILPPAMLDAAASCGYSVQPESRGFLFNAAAAEVLDFLNMGTVAATPTAPQDLLDPAGDRRDDSGIDRPGIA
ncbi:VWA domain-containing protein [Nocardia noduli]|uniref:VWA domain-containing protein n=1 Tax=Nocardia noduli TaxID=2815722 RepID=UPI001C2110DD|nr:VWA domain-containing protein [Nocardia noduli]